MLRLIYLGNYYELNKLRCVVKYAKELSGIANQLWKDADDKTKKFIKEENKGKKKKDINLKDSKATLMSWCLQSIECGILLKIHKWFTDNGYNVGQFCHDGLTIEHNEYNHYPDFLPKDIIEEVNDVINKIGGKYNYEGYTVTLSEKKMEIKDLGNIIVDPNVLPHCDKKKVLAKVVKEKVTKKNPITLHTITLHVIRHHCHHRHLVIHQTTHRSTQIQRLKLQPPKVHFPNHQHIGQQLMAVVTFLTRLLVKTNLQR